MGTFHIFGGNKPRGPEASGALHARGREEQVSGLAVVREGACGSPGVRCPQQTRGVPESLWEAWGSVRITLGEHREVKRSHLQEQQSRYAGEEGQKAQALRGSGRTPCSRLESVVNSRLTSHHGNLSLKSDICWPPASIGQRCGHQ